MTNTNNLNIVLQPPPSDLVEKAKTEFLASFPREDYIKDVNAFTAIPFPPGLPTYPGQSSPTAVPFGRTPRDIEVKPYGYRYQFKTRTSAPPVSWKPLLPPSPYVVEYMRRSSLAYGIIAKRVLGIDSPNGASKRPKVIALEYKTQIQFTNTITENIRYSHYLKNDNGEYSAYGAENIVNALNCAGNSLPSDDTILKQEVMKFEVSIKTYWRVYPTIVLDNTIPTPAFIDINPDRVVLDTTNAVLDIKIFKDGKELINQDVFDSNPDSVFSKKYTTKSSPLSTTSRNFIYPEIIKILNKSYAAFLKKYYFPDKKELNGMPSANTIQTEFKCTDDCDRNYKLDIESRLSSRNDYIKARVSPRSIQTTGQQPPTSLPNLTQNCALPECEISEDPDIIVPKIQPQ